MNHEQRDLFAASEPPDKKKEPQPPEKKELGGLTERLASIIRTVSGKRSLEVTTEIDPGTFFSLASQGKDARQTWFRISRRDPVTRKPIGEFVHIPERIVESKEEVAKGKAAHEGGHSAITRFGEFVPDEVLQELGFHALMAAAEERPTDQVVRERFAGGGEWVDEARADSVRDAAFAERAAAQLGYAPKSVQLNDLIVYTPQFEKIPERYDRDVVRLYEKIRRTVERVEKTLPADNASEEEIVAKAKERYRTVYTRLWPEVKKLVEQDLETEKLHQMLQEAMEAMKQEQTKAGDEGMKSGEDEKEEEAKSEGMGIPQEIREELRKLLKEVLAGTKEIEKGLPKKKPGSGEKAEKQEPGEKAGDAKATEESRPDDPAMPKSAEGAKSGGEQAGPDEAFPMESLSGAIRSALQKIFDSLPEPEKQALLARAKKALEELEDEAVRELSGKLEETAAETHKEFHDRRGKEEREERSERLFEKKREEEKTIEEKLKDIKKKQEKVEAGKGLYEKTYAEIHDLEEDLYRRLEDIFTPNIKRTVRLASSGSRISLPAVFRWEADRRAGTAAIDNKIFETVHRPEKKDYVITVLVDLSGSMADKRKIEETFKGVVLLAEVLSRLGVKYEILGFQDVVLKFKEFHEDLNDAIRKKISGMVAEVHGTNPGGHNHGGYNDDGPCLEEASKGLGEQPSKEKFLLVLSDGLPLGRRSTPADLTRAVQRILRETDQKLIGLGLGSGTEHVKEYYPASLPNIDVKKLPEVFGNLLEDVILHPQKYSAAAS